MPSGSCECGSVRFTINGEMRPVVACHCSQCRKTSGHFWAATQVDADALTIEDTGSLSWYSSTPGVCRGFCGVCGSSLFWEKNGEGRISVAAGAIDKPTELRMAKNIHVADKGDYYELTDGLPRS